MKPPDRGWAIFLLLFGWSVWMVACGRTWAHANTRQGYAHGTAACVEQAKTLAKYVEMYTHGDSIAVPVDTNGDGVMDLVWQKKIGWKHWQDTLRIVGLP